METDIIVDSKEQVYGIIYKIINTINGKEYIGQTLSHRKNHNRYRPFGYIGRFKDHISEALCNTKEKQCRYLNQAIRKYGKEVFNVELVEKCSIELLNEKEIYYISHCQSLYPNGYNLTIGGKNMYTKKITIDNEVYNNHVIQSDKKHSDSTKNKISEGIKNYYQTHPYKKQDLAKRIQQQHYLQKIKIGSQFVIDETNIDQYLSIRKRNIAVIFERKRDGKRVIFHKASYESTEDTINRAKQYLYDVIKQNNQNSCDIAKLRETPKASTTKADEESFAGSGEISEVG